MGLSWFLKDKSRRLMNRLCAILLLMLGLVPVHAN